MAATLGGLIKDLRMQKKMSQLEISLSLGWKEASRLSRIEQGRSARPSRQLLDNLTNAMRLTPEERHRLYVVGNYLPNQKDVARARSKLANLIDNWPYPATALDFAWRIIYTNQKLYNLYQIPPRDQQQIESGLPNVLEIIFNPGFIGNQGEDLFYIRLLAHFQFAQKSRTNERWYLELIQKMMRNDYFRRLWPLAHKYVTADYDLFNFVQKKVGDLNFYDAVLPVMNDARFMIEYYFPSDSLTHGHYQG